ncbi:MAG: hypothetical protein LUD81_05170 [Clostridiales bacterium]|nr:hypothetical protein [Clostridiales bacterium]
MEDLRELLNIYFSDGAEDKTVETAESTVYENTYQSFYNSFLNEEKYITNLFENILKENSGNFNNTRESVIERAYEGAGKIGGVSAAAYFNDCLPEGEEKASSFVYDNKYISNEKTENIQSIQNNEEEGKNEKNEKNEKNVNGEALILNENNERSSDINYVENLSDYFGGYAAGCGGESKNEQSLSEAEYKNHSDNYSNYNEETLISGDYLSEEFYNSEDKPGGAEGFAAGADFSAFVPSYTTALNNYYEEAAEGDSYASEASEKAALNYFFEAEENTGGDGLKDILNTYLGNEYGGINVTNNISPVFNMYTGEGSRDTDIEEIAEKIGEMLAEAAAGSASGFYK